jgi:hypothetical protein
MRADVSAEIEDLIDKYRDRCLWFLRPDYLPHSDDEILRVLDFIERYGDRVAFERAQRLRQWLLHPTSAAS